MKSSREKFAASRGFSCFAAAIRGWKEFSIFPQLDCKTSDTWQQSQGRCCQLLLSVPFVPAVEVFGRKIFSLIKLFVREHSTIVEGAGGESSPWKTFDSRNNFEMKTKERIHCWGMETPVTELINHRQKPSSMNNKLVSFFHTKHFPPFGGNFELLTRSHISIPFLNRVSGCPLILFLWTSHAFPPAPLRRTQCKSSFVCRLVRILQIQLTSSPSLRRWRKLENEMTCAGCQKPTR